MKQAAVQLAYIVLAVLAAGTLLWLIVPGLWVIAADVAVGLVIGWTADDVTDALLHRMYRSSQK